MPCLNSSRVYIADMKDMRAPKLAAVSPIICSSGYCTSDGAVQYSSSIQYSSAKHKRMVQYDAVECRLQNNTEQRINCMVQHKTMQ